MLDRPILYPTAYRWAIIAAALDIVCTYLILSLGGSELNMLARHVIDAGGVPGMVAFKFAIVAGVITVCEFVGRRRADTGRRLARAAVVLNAFPAIVGATQLTLN